ncbi:MAG: tetratricopeptide repeat protein [Phyllobacterium sp.]
MLTFDRIPGRFLGCTVAIGLTVSSAFAFDAAPAPEVKKSPFDVFKFGMSAYKQGHKGEAIEAYRYAGENGQLGARWKLARMYADGDGVAENDLEAYKMFEKIIQHGAEPGTREMSYVADAYDAIAGYVRRGIPNSQVKANPGVARQLYEKAAVFGNSNAQYELGKMLLNGEGGRLNQDRAAQYFWASAKKGHAGALAMLGDLMFKAGKTVRGLAMLTAAFERAPQSDRDWISQMQEEAFASAPEADRRTAVSLAANILSNGVE